MPDHDEFVGRFNAVNFVEIRARVSGYLQEIDFRDGQIVKKGDPLFKIDPRPYEIAADQARGALKTKPRPGRRSPRPTWSVARISRRRASSSM